MAGNKKADDLKIIGLNGVGISLSGIGQRCGIHHTTVTGRLKALNIPPADTRRAFMEEIFDGLSVTQQEWLIEKVNTGTNIKDLIRGLIIKDFISRKP